MIFVIHLTEPRVKPQQSLALHLMVTIVLCAVGFASGVLFWFTDVSPTIRGAYAPLAIFGTACFIAGVVVGTLAMAARRREKSGRHGQALRLAELVLLLIGTVVFLWHGWNFPALMFGILAAAVGGALAGERDGGKQTVRFDEGGIHRSFALRSRLLEWREVRRVLLRHGTLTIDLLDNRLFQYRVEEQEVDAEIFEPWAAAQAEKGRVGTPTSDW